MLPFETDLVAASAEVHDLAKRGEVLVILTLVVEPDGTRLVQTAGEPVHVYDLSRTLGDWADDVMDQADYLRPRATQ